MAKTARPKPELTAGQESALHHAELNEKRGTWLERDIRRDVFNKLRERGFVDGYHSNWHLTEKALRYLGMNDVQIAKHHVARLTYKMKHYSISVYDYRPGSFDRMELVAENIDNLNTIAIELTRWEIRAGVAK